MNLKNAKTTSKGKFLYRPYFLGLLHLLIICVFPNSIFAFQESKTETPKVRSITELNALPTKICFGSCCNQNKDQPILNTIVKQSPELFIYLGDNIYGDTKNMDVLKAKYKQLGDKPEFQNLRKNTTVLSVWDDHDYGWNDAGKEYEFKEQSKEIFMEFWQVPSDSPRRKHKGIYGSHILTDKSKQHTLQVILLDTRTFRDPLMKRDRSRKEFKNAYQPDPNPEKTFLGDEQWKWLETELSKPADLRIVCSSIQFGHAYNGWESWTNFPAQQKKMYDLIRKTKANGIVFISGDVHWAEISKRQPEGLYPIYDITASGLTEDWHNVEPNKFRVGKPFRNNHFGMIEIDWQKESPSLDFKIIDVEGKVQIEHKVDSLDTLQLEE